VTYLILIYESVTNSVSVVRWLTLHSRTLNHDWIASERRLTYESESELYYDRRSVGQSVLVSSPHLGLMTRFLLLSDHCGFVDMGRPLWREDASVVYNCCCLRQRSHSQVRVPRGSWPHFTVSDLRLPQPGGPGPCIYIPVWPLTYELITCPFIPWCEQNTEHYIEQFVCYCVYSLPRERANTE
jgi:hypothetical protein